MGKNFYPGDLAAFEKEWPRFQKFLTARGSEVLPASNPFELARFTTPVGVGIIYRNQKNRIENKHWQNGAAEAWKAWKHGSPWEVGKRIGRTKSDHKVRAVLARDGDLCCFCKQPFTEYDPMTREHYVPIAHEGSNHLSNLGLAHFSCNTEADHLSVSEKIDFAIRKRAEAAIKNQQRQQRNQDDERDRNQNGQWETDGGREAAARHRTDGGEFPEDIGRDDHADDGRC